MTEAEQIVVVAPPSALVWVTLIGVVVASFTFVVNTVDRILHHRREQLREEVEAIDAFGKRFIELDKARNKISPEDQRDLDRLMKDYWSLQIDQWVFFYREVISQDVYVSWLLHVVDHMRGRVVGVPTDNARESWQTFGRSIARNDLRVRLMMEASYKEAEKIGHPHDLTVDEIAALRGLLSKLADTCRTARYDHIVEKLNVELRPPAP